MFMLWLIVLIESAYYPSTIAVDQSFFSRTQNANIETTSINSKYLSLQRRSFYSLDSIDKNISDSNSKASLSQEEFDKNNEPNSRTTPKIAPLVLQPNIDNAIDTLNGGLLVPLVIPAVASAKNVNFINTNDTVNPLLINDLNLTTIRTDTNILLGEDDDTISDMDVAEDIVFRPLFRYRQEQREQFRSRQKAKYYQPYLYTHNRYY